MSEIQNNINDHDCGQVMNLLETLRGRDLVLAEQMDKVILHLATCHDCLVQERQNIEIAQFAADMPAMEVPDTLLPSIMKAVAMEAVCAESPAKVTSIRLIPGFGQSQLILAAMAAIAVLMLAENSFDSVDGWYAWFACAALISVQQVFFSGSSKLRLISQHVTAR